LLPVTRVSVIIPSYNRERLLGETLDSLRRQTYGDWEAIVVDDSSHDGTLQVAREHARSNGRIRAVPRRGERKGGDICRNQGLALARGEYIVFLDSDDLIAPNCLAGRIEAMENAPDCGFITYLTELFSHTIGDRKVLWNTYSGSNDLHRFLSLDTVWLTTGPIWRKQALVQLGGFDEEALSFQDWALHVQALAAGIKYLKKPICDNFHRFQYDDTNTIYSVAGRHPDHLNSHEKLFAKTFRQLQSAGLVDCEIRGRVAGMFWWLAMLWHRQANLKAADRVWRRANRLGLCNRRRYLEGRLIFRIYHFRGGGRVSRLIQRFWLSEYTRALPDHLCTTPVDRMKQNLPGDSRETDAGRPTAYAHRR
jgi:glycosyltransferase involved in cell wall biosynthesis